MDPSAVFPSPDGRFILEIFSVPMRMSHVVDCPTLYDAKSSISLFNAGSFWDASNVRWSENSQQLTMDMRHYDNGLHQFVLLLDMKSETATLTFGEHVIFTGAFSDVSKSMEKVSNIKKYIKEV